MISKAFRITTLDDVAWGLSSHLTGNFTYEPNWDVTSTTLSLWSTTDSAVLSVPTKTCSISLRVNFLLAGMMAYLPASRSLTESRRSCQFQHSISTLATDQTTIARFSATIQIQINAILVYKSDNERPN